MKVQVPFRKREYVLIFPTNKNGLVDAGVSQAVAKLEKHQDQLETNLSTDTRKVVRLTERQVEKLQETIPGVEVYENREVSIPEKSDMNLQPGQFAEPMDLAFAIHGADKLHEMNIKGNSSPFAPVIATIDTGVAPHPLFGNRGLYFRNNMTNRTEPFFDDHGHGTHTFGIDGVGFAPEAQYIGEKVLDARGSGTYASVLAGIEDAVKWYDENLAPKGRPLVINLSLGGPATDVTKDLLHSKLPALKGDRDIYFIFAAGNSGPRPGTIGTPGNWVNPYAAAVAAMDTKETMPMSDDSPASFSSRGGPDVSKGQNALRDGGLAADGVKVNSTWKTGGYAQLSGTSMAAPMVTGAVTELLDYRGKLAVDGLLKVDPKTINVLDLLRESAVDHANIDRDTEGFGELDVAAAAILMVKKYGKLDRYHLG
jgi:subtilisin family serine protease